MKIKLSLQNLNTFATAAQTLSFQAAAAILHVTPSAVSHQIRNLESVLGYPLFERLDKAVKLTHRGQQLYLDITEPLQQIHQASRKALRCTDDLSLALSVAPVFATRWLLPRLKDFRAQYPNVSLSVVATSSIADFRNDPFDAAIRMGSGHWPDTLSTRLFNKCIVAVCHPNLLIKNGGQFGIEQLSTQSIIHNASMKGLWQEWLNSTGLSTFPIPTGIEVPSTAQVLEAISAEEAIGLVDLNFIDQDIKDGRLVYACSHQLSGDDGYFLTYPETLYDRTALQIFKQWLEAQIEGNIG